MPASYTFHSNPAAIAFLLHSPSGPTGRWLTEKGNRAVNGAKVRANVDTGLMRSRIEFRLEVEGGKLVGYVAAKTNYSLYVHEGFGSYPGNPFLRDGVREAFGR